MLVSRTPLRVSFLGGGSDYRDFFERQDGHILGVTIDKYVYVVTLPLPIVAEEKFRFTYRKTESVQTIDDFQHPVMKSTLKYLNWHQPMNFATMGDLPGRSGLGSSSSFTVGLLNLLFEIRGEKKSPNEIAEIAVLIERELLAEPGGLQDQYHASLGGFSTYTFSNSGVTSQKIDFKPGVREYISDSLVLVPMLQERDSSIYAQKTKDKLITSVGRLDVAELANLALETAERLTCETIPEKALTILADAMNLGWKLKNGLIGSSDDVVSKFVELVMKGGAASAKLCGAGGSGFILALVHPKKMQNFLADLQDFNPIRVSAVDHGSEIILGKSN
jgi:D-glycero-alpha-D-manno-heptose-7-phosphate kinase